MHIGMPQLQETGPLPVNLPKCVAVYDNIAECGDELAFRAGDILTVIEKDTGGLQGWWLCSLRGRQGICPGNRLRMVGDMEQVLQRRSWHTPANKVVMPHKYGEVYLYDSPRPPLEQLQYDVPPPTMINEGESYDTPRPLGQLTPSSSLSSLTTDSNRSSLIQDYDIPRPPRTVQSQVYDVPKDSGFGCGMGGGLELWEAVDRLGRLEAEALAGVRGLVGEAVGPHWPAPPHRLPHLRAALATLTPALHRLAAFAHQVLANAHHSGLENKLKPLVAAVVDAEKVVEEEARALDATSWDMSTPHLETLITAAKPLTDDIRQLASFIQGNSTLLFKKSSGWAEDYDYVNLEGRGGKSEVEEKQEEGPILDPIEKQVLAFYCGQSKILGGKLTTSIDNLLSSVETNQPPKIFLKKAKSVIVAGEGVAALTTAAGRPSPTLHEALGRAALAATNAATRFPSVTAVQAMVDSVIAVSHEAASVNHSLRSAHHWKSPSY